MKHLRLRAAITIGSLLVASGHLLWPHLRIDGITVSLILVALLPWMTVLLKSLELPGLFKVEFHPQPADVQRKRLAEEAKDEIDAGTTTAASTERQPRLARVAAYLLAEELALRALNEDEFSGSIRRHVVVKGRSDLAFDGVGVRNGIEVLIEVKFTRFLTIPDRVVSDLLARIRAVHQEHREHHSGGGMPLLLVIVAELADDDVAVLRQSLEEKYSAERRLEIRVLGMADLRRRYGVDQ